MLRNYLSAALRHLVRNKLYAVINIGGLAVGFTAALLIALFVRDEFSYDRWIPEHDRVIMIAATAAFPHYTDHLAMAPYFVARLLKDEVPGIETAARFGAGPVGVRHGETEFQERISWADPTLFDVLKFPVFMGDLATALRQPGSVVLTRSMARKYFGTDAAIGQTLELNRQVTMRVTAVLEDFPSNTHFDAGIIIYPPNSPLELFDRNPPPANNMPPAVYTYARIVDGVTVEGIRRGLVDLVQRHQPQFKSHDATITLDAVPITAIHLQPTRTFAMRPSGDAGTAYGVLLVAVLTVVVASTNFINLATALAAKRGTEAGIRKLSGAERQHLILQFICETGAYVAVAMALAVVLTGMLLPSLNAFLQRTMIYRVDPPFVAAIAGIVLVVGVVAGAYPAFIMSRFAPIRAFKNVFFETGRVDLRRALVAFQFAVLIGLGLVTAIIYGQLRYATNEGLRFNKDQVLQITTPCRSAFATEVRRTPGVLSAACSISPILQSGIPPTRAMTRDGRAVDPAVSVVDVGYFELFDIAPVAGRLFSQSFGGDVAPGDAESPVQPAVVINEALARAMGFSAPDEAVGQTITWRRRLSPVNMNETDFRASDIIGVVPDFARGAMRDTRGSVPETTPPTLFWVDPLLDRVLNVRLDGAHVPEALAAIDSLWKRVGEPRPIARSFLSQEVQTLYLDLTRQMVVLAALAVAGVFIAALGLFGLSAFNAEQRTKEIGIRKAMGAKTADILGLLIWQFIQPVLWASVVAWPVAYFVMRHWLENFANRITLSPWLFAGATVLALAIAVVTVAGHAMLVARTHPVHALRYE